MFAAADQLTLYFQSLKVGRIYQPTFRTRTWSGAFTRELSGNNATADRVKDYILAAQLFAAQLHLAEGGQAAPPLRMRFTASSTFSGPPSGASSPGMDV
jgi:hypothetical protein